MSAPVANHPDSNILRSVIEHVFMPPKLPQNYPDGRTEREINIALCDSLIKAAQDFRQTLPSSQLPLWMQMVKMMELARRAAEAPLMVVDVQRALSGMAIGGTSG